MDFSFWCWSWGVGCRDCVWSVCGKNGLWTVPTRVWTILVVIMNEVQEGEVRAQPVHYVVHAVLGLLVQGICPRVQCLCTKWLLSWECLSFSMIGETHHNEHRLTGEKEAVLKVFETQITLHPAPF